MYKTKAILTAILCLILFSSARQDEGMFPLSELGSVNLRKAGLKISPKEIYNPEGTSLVNALVRVGGCTGSFVSDAGLIITNHHCAFGAVAAISTPEQDYLTNGFYAESAEEERQTSISAWITESYADVSDRVLEGANLQSDPGKRADWIKNNIQKIVSEEQALHPDMDIQISEMFIGRSYTLFRYVKLDDIRLVYAPPRSIGEFGGETDNWEWPRHNGDFAFFRAYVAPDGKPAAYSKDNIPFKPKRYLEINAKGVVENDFVFVMGYPGRTYRHQPVGFLGYQYQYQMPFIIDWFDFQIETMQNAGKNDAARRLQYASRIKSLANTSKNFKGKIQGIRRTGLYEARRNEETEILNYAQNSGYLKDGHVNAIKRIDELYTENNKRAEKSLVLSQIFSSSNAAKILDYLASHYDAWQGLRSTEERMRYAEQTMKPELANLRKQIGAVDIVIEPVLMRKILEMGWELDGENRINTLKQRFKNSGEIDTWVQNIFSSAPLSNTEQFFHHLDNRPWVLMERYTAQIEFFDKLRAEWGMLSASNRKNNDEIAALYPLHLEARMAYKKAAFIPDANSTLRLTYGYIRGYRPNDAVINEPFTTIRGLLQKVGAAHDYTLEDHLYKILAEADPNSIVCMLYNLDTTGGNSGSPVLDKNGRLIGVNFDRAYGATINDYAWNEEYSRSIGVDIRYVRFVLDKISNAQRVLGELGI